MNIGNMRGLWDSVWNVCLVEVTDVFSVAKTKFLSRPGRSPTRTNTLCPPSIAPAHRFLTRDHHLSNRLPAARDMHRIFRQNLDYL